MLNKKDTQWPDFFNLARSGKKAEAALLMYQYQYSNNPLYADYCNQLNKKPDSVCKVNDIPFLPISFFRTHRVVTGLHNSFPLIFESSGTTGNETSKHYVANQDIYEQALLSGFEQYYGSVEDYNIIALLPSYLERPNTSLVYMAKTLMNASKKSRNAFFLYEREHLQKTLSLLEESSSKTILLGVTFALLDFAEQYRLTLKNTIIMETGGMKGRKKELTRDEVHAILCKQFNLTKIHAEYGMTELLSQAYSSGNGIFFPTATMDVYVRDINDPFEINNKGTGCLNIIDFANIHSCAFIATDDIGTIHSDGSFSVLGRVDNSILRGCNLMAV